LTAVESTDKPVKIEVEILQDRPTRALIEASRWAAMVCVGSVGLKHSAEGRMGSTAAALASSSHCPVAVVRGHDPLHAEQQWVAAELDDSPASVGVLRRAFEEAQLRGVPLRVLTVSRWGLTDCGAVVGGNRLGKAQLDRRLAEWKKRYADVDMRAVAVHGSTLNFLTENARSIQLLVVGRERAHGITELVGPPRYAALHNAACSVLICETQNIL
jgi:nucleotide-binding universal stress UspA family protein